MKAPQASLATLPIKGQATRPELLPDAGTLPALPSGLPSGADMVQAPPARVGTVSLNLRIPAELHHALRVRAFAHDTSITALLLDGAARVLEADR